MSFQKSLGIGFLPKLHVVVTAFVVMAVGSGCAQTPRKADIFAEPVMTPALAPVDAIMQSCVDKNIFPGGVLIVGTPTEILWAKPYGRLTYSPDSPATTMDTMYDLASITKVMGTATSTWLLLDDERLRLDDPVSKWVPGFDANGKEGVTVKDLATHISGLKAYEAPSRIEANRPAEVSKPDAMVHHFAALKASYTPREKFVYSCLNFLTLAHVNEVAARESQEDLLQRRVYTPLGMTSTTYRPTEKQMPRIAPTFGGKSDVAGKVHDPLASYHGVTESCPGNAGLFSTGPDMARYCTMILSNGKWRGRQIIKEETIALSTKVQTPDIVDQDRGIGWDIYESEPWVTPLNRENGSRVIGHTGYTGTFFWLDTRSKTYVIILSNRCYPDDKDRSKGGISQARKDIVDLVLKNVPEYREYFAQANPVETVGK